MKTFIALIALCTTGCFAAQYDSINNNADNQLSYLDRQCRENMTEWCAVQYRIVQENRARELSDLEARRHAAAQIMSQSFQRRPHVKCESHSTGYYTHTECR